MHRPRHAEPYTHIATYTMYSFVSGRGHDLHMIERLIGRLMAQEAHFAMMLQAARAFDARPSSSTLIRVQSCCFAGVG